mmetsp:Transcript_3276/g.6942  ORF Transcript_3276/g.6942 Transcript_3276/m.6942 type:complete len:517 (-) Transcript_3276:34-1584(-)
MKFSACIALSMVSSVKGSPREYFVHTPQLVQKLHAQARESKQNPANQSLCGEKIDGQAMWYTKYDCSLASANVSFVYNNSIVNAKKGDVIPWACESAMCPPPARRDCYLNPDICEADEYCWIDQHERWGPWTMGENGKTPDEDFCNKDLNSWISKQNLNKAQIVDLRRTHRLACKGTKKASGQDVYKTIRGQCVKYRKEEQSCSSYSLTFRKEFGFDSSYARKENGNVFKRPLRCDERTHICTGPEFDVLPNTCVKKRPADVCYYGPWWDSSVCLRTEANAPTSGLAYNQAVQAFATAILLFPGEIMSPGSCEFWDTSSAIGRQANVTRKQIYNIIAALWPTAAGAPPTLDDLLKYNPTPLQLAGGVEECYEQQGNASSSVPSMLHNLTIAATRPNLVWSLVHFAMHNQPRPMSFKRVQASRALAEFLMENFWCTDCRGFFAIGVVKEYGLPPSTMDPDSHAKWWWWGHNVASEHVATTRGGHPWEWQIGSQGNTDVQNPFFMAWEDAQEMSTLKE